MSGVTGYRATYYREPCMESHAEVRKYRKLREIIEALAAKYDTPIADGPCAGQRALYGGGDLAYRLRSVLASVDAS